MPDLLASVRRHFDRLQSVWPDNALEQSARRWLEKMRRWQDDMAFAERFGAGVPIAGAKPGDYLQRELKVGGRPMLAGIRFRGGETEMPFVDLLAWDGPLDLPAAAREAARAWSVFEPRWVRILTDVMPDITGCLLDQTVHAGTAERMAVGPCDPAVTLLPCTDPADAAELVASAYAGFDAAFRHAVLPASAETLADCRDDGVLCWIEVDGKRAGIWATQPGTVDWLAGQIVTEEVLLEPFRGRGLARTVQRLAARLLSTHDVMLGTVDRINEASRQTATAAGRREVMRYVWVQIPA